MYAHDSINVVLNGYQKEGGYFLAFEQVELKVPKEVFERIMKKIRFKPIRNMTEEIRMEKVKPPAGWIIWGKSNSRELEF
jgi:hypothetical protein